MASIFTKIIEGELPGRFVWKDDLAVAFLTIAPLKPGHTLVVPREEIDHWLAAEPGLLEHLFRVAHKVGQGVQEAFSPTRVGVMIAGLEVPHLHIHLTPIWKVTDLDFANADSKAKPEDMDAAAEKLRAALRAAGHAEVSD